MPLTTINASKGLEVSYRPLLLYTFSWPDGSALRVASIGLNGSEGGVQYGGEDYLGRVIDQDLGALQGFSAQGLDILPQVQVRLADPDKLIYSNYHGPKGFRGATLTVRFVLYDVAARIFSSDSKVRFIGLCDAATADFDSLSVTATNRLTLSRRQIPRAAVSRRCPHTNPTTPAQRAQADNRDSIFFGCGETNNAATPCQYTKATCTRPLRFAGSEWDSPPGTKSRDYINGWTNIENNPLRGRIGRPIPLVYGTAWVSGIPVSESGDGNSTRGEVILGWGRMESIITVVVNDVQLPAANSIDGAVYRVEDPLLRYNVITRGNRDGARNLDAPWNGNGDPWGSICVIEWVVPRRAQDSSGEPNVKALVRGRSVMVYSAPGVFTETWTDNPVWILMDLMVEAGWTYAGFDLQTWIDAAAVAAAPINYIDQDGNNSQHARWRCSLVVDRRTAAADVIRRVRVGAGMDIIEHNGLLQIFPRGTLASQQPAAVSGSNYDTPTASFGLAGGAQNGFFAYHFNRVREVNGRSTLREITPPSNQQPNRVLVPFVNDARDYVQDVVTMVDSSSLALAGEVAEQFDGDGVAGFDQAKRIARRRIAEANYGNSRNDPGGTQAWQFEHGMETVGLRPGQICLLSDDHNGLDEVPVRITAIKPTADYRTSVIAVTRHRDQWYLDSYGQDGDPRGHENPRDRLARPSYPWRAGAEAPTADDPMYAASDKTFRLRESHEDARDGTSLCRLVAEGAWPVNVFSDVRPPVVARQGSTTAVGGTIPGGGVVYYHEVFGKDADGKLTAPSVVCETAVIAGGSTHTVTIPVSSWPAGIVGYEVYSGTSPHSKTRQVVSAGTPATITLASYQVNDIGCPDTEFDKLSPRVRIVEHAGVWGAALTGVGAGTMTIEGAGWTAGEWAGRDVSLLGKAPGGAQLLVRNYRITANTADTLTTPQSTADLSPGDVVTMRAQATNHGADWVEDFNFRSTFAPDGLTPNAERGKILIFIAGTAAGDQYRIKGNTDTRITIEGPWLRSPDATSRFIIVSPDWVVTQETDTLSNGDPGAQILQAVDIANYARRTVLIAVYTLDGGGNPSFDAITQFREIYVFGAEGSLGQESEVAYL